MILVLLAAAQAMVCGALSPLLSREQHIEVVPRLFRGYVALEALCFFFLWIRRPPSSTPFPSTPLSRPLGTAPRPLCRYPGPRQNPHPRRGEAARGHPHRGPRGQIPSRTRRPRRACPRAASPRRG